MGRQNRPRAIDLLQDQADLVLTALTIKKTLRHIDGQSCQHCKVYSNSLEYDLFFALHACQFHC